MTGNSLPVTTALAVEMYRRMRLIRRFEEHVVELVNSDEIAGDAHVYIGEEAVAVGVCTALRPSDAITSTHRGHGHVIAKGGDVRYMLAELMGRETGYNKGRGGSMHIADFSLGVYGANGIVAAATPMACGAAYALRLRQQGQVVASFFGDGAVNQGVLLESLNLAAIGKLPVIFVCENNGYAVTTPVSSVTSGELWKRAVGFGVAALVVDGMDVLSVHKAAYEAVSRARCGDGPTFLECRTYRYLGHETAERVMKLDYRSEEEIASWRRRDPINRLATRLTKTRQWGPADRAALDAAIEAELEVAVAFARSSRWPSADAALEYMYASPYSGIPAKGWES